MRTLRNMNAPVSVYIRIVPVFSLDHKNYISLGRDLRVALYEIIAPGTQSLIIAEHFAYHRGENPIGKLDPAKIKLSDCRPSTYTVIG